MVRTRIAPSPTGYPHIATIYQALFDYAFAKKHNGKFFIRIEDTDRERFVADAEEKLYEAIDWFDLTEDESPRKEGKYGTYRQSERLDLYKKYAEELVTNGHAYYCFCTKEKLDEVRQQQQKEKKPMMYNEHCRNLSEEEIATMFTEKTNRVIRLKVPENEKIIVKDEIRGEITFDSDLIDDQVLLKSDGFPTYHLAVVVDDHLMETTHVVRGEEWLSSFPKHMLLYRYFGWEMPKFYHTAVLRNPDHSKLSKRQGHTNVSWYQEEGYLPEAILNYIALLGWSHPEEKEIFSLDEFISLFELKDIKPIGPIFDIEKLKWMNGEYIRNLSIDELTERLREFYPAYQNIDNKMFEQIVLLAQSRMEALKDFDVLAHHFLEVPGKAQLGAKNSNELAIVKDLYTRLTELSSWDKENILQILLTTLKKYKVKMPVLYRLFTGKEKGLPLPETLVLLEKEKVLKRLKNNTTI